MSFLDFSQSQTVATLETKLEPSRLCNFCGLVPLKENQKKFCSTACHGFARRGSGDDYIRIRLDGGKRVFLHRYIFESEVRPLEPGEIVHHKNENKHDNRVENLEALSDQAEHLRKHNYFRGRRFAKPVETAFDPELRF